LIHYIGNHGLKISGFKFTFSKNKHQHFIATQGTHALQHGPFLASAMSFVICWSMGLLNDRAIAEAVSCWLPTTAAWVRTRVWQVGFVVDKVASGQVFSEYFSFPCQNRTFLQLLHPRNHLGQVAEALR
jgi:hypothetical protein